MERQQTYEMLGAPVVLYRHKPSHLLGYHGKGASYREKFRNVEGWKERMNAAARVRSRWYYELDQESRKELETKKRKYSRQEKKRTCERTQATSPQAEDSKENGASDASNDERGPDDTFWDNSEFLDSRIRPILLQSRQELLASDPDIQMFLKRYKLLDHSYVPGQESCARKSFMKGSFHVDRWNASRDFCMERRKADLSYLAPFNTAALVECSELAPDNEIISTEKGMEYSRSLDESSPQVFGNCLVCLPCHCCEGSWFLIHRSGNNLSKVCVSKLNIPQSLCATPKSGVETSSVDVGNRILQISECGPRYVVVRTASSVSLFLLVFNKSEHGENRSCACVSLLKSVSEINLQSFQSLTSLDIACHPKYGNDLVGPKLAVLSRSLESNRNFIHHAMGIEEPTEHLIRNLRNIELVDFSCFNPMILWSAATSYVRPALVEDYCTARLAFGHGSSLFSVDLRCNKGTFQWSPSEAEFVTECIHSISGIHTDWHRTTTVWVSSTSAGKLWEIDSRMPCREVSSWSMPGLVKDSSTVMPKMGHHGSGTLMIQPALRYYQCNGNVNPPILLIDKTPGSVIEIYQQAESGPRFQTSSLESSAAHSLSSFNGEFSSIAFSSVFPVTDSSENVFSCGLACFRTRTSDFLTNAQMADLGLSNHQGNVLCTITTTSKGDIFSQSLLESSVMEEQKRVAHQMLPIGSSMLVVPNVESNGQLGYGTSGNTLGITISNRVEAAIDTELSVVMNRSECRHFSASRMEQLSSQSANEQLLVEPDLLEMILHPTVFKVAKTKDAIYDLTTVKVGSSLIREALSNQSHDLPGLISSSLEANDIGRSDLSHTLLKTHEKNWNNPLLATHEEASKSGAPSPVRK